MPDTYTSQFSGEEIDSALRAAQIISGADTPAELREKLEIRGDTIPVSATDPTPVSEALTASGGGVNPNLLDNGFFARPVNQRGGYYIPAGIKYNTLSRTEAGTTDKAYPVIGYIGQDPLITVNGTNYIVGKSVQVPGYCTAGYCIDRWVLNGDTATLNGDGITFVSPSPGRVVCQPIEFPDLLSGKTVTFSIYAKVISGEWFLTDTGNFASVHRDVPISTGITSWTFEVADANKFGSSAKCVGFWGGTEGGQITVLAAKLELGSTQTLAHKENEKWVLNEIPDFGEQLRRCQRYFVRLTNAYGYGWTYSSSVANFLVPLPTTLRANPVVKFTKNGEIQTINGSKAVTSFEAKGIHPNGLAIDLHNSANALISGTPVTWHDSSMDISADL